MTALIIVGIIVAIPFTLWGLLILMDWLASFVGEGPHITESNDERKTSDAGGDEHSRDNINLNITNQFSCKH